MYMCVYACVCVYIHSLRHLYVYSYFFLQKLHIEPCLLFSLVFF